VDTQTVYELDYAAVRTKSAGRPFFKSILAVMAVCGIAANTWFVYVTVDALHRAHWAYLDLMRDPRAYGREVSAEMIASLREPYSLWSASGALALASVFGLALAVHLLRSTWLVDRSASRRGHDGMARYRRCKPIGVALTAAAFFWFGSANLSFWVAATRHYPVGGGPPIIETLMLIAGALLPWWWIGRRPGSKSAVEERSSNGVESVPIPVDSA
jgi:hypothetical protein